MVTDVFTHLLRTYTESRLTAFSKEDRWFRKRATRSFEFTDHRVTETIPPRPHYPKRKGSKEGYLPQSQFIIGFLQWAYELLVSLQVTSISNAFPSFQPGES